MAELEGLSVSLTADSAGLDRGMRSAEQSVARAEQSVTTSLSRMDRAMEQVNRSTAAIAQRFGQFAAILGVGTLGAMTAKALDYADAWTQVGNRLRLVSSDAGELKATQEQLFAAAQKAGVGMSSVVDVYSKASQAAGELGASQEQLTRFSGGVAQALAVSGTSAEAAAGAMQQLGQLLGSARVQAEEFNSIMDGAPRIAKAVAAGLDEAGGSTSRLKQLINDGRISNKQFFDAFLSQIPKIHAEFETTVPTVEQSMERLRNAMTKAIGEANEATGATRKLAEGITALADNLSTVATGAATVGAALAGVYVARGLVPAVAAGLQFVQAQVALRTELVQNTGHILQKEAALRAGAAAAAQAASADLAAAQAAAAKARADLAARAAQYEAAVALDGAIGKTARLMQAEEALTAARTARAAADLRVAETTAAVTMATQAQAGAIARTTVAATLLSRAKDGLSSLLALVGGPWGAAFLAAGAAVTYLATRTSDADKAQEAYNRTLTEGRRRIEELTGASRERANQLREEQRNELSAAQAAAAAAAQKVATLQALIAEQRASADPSEAGGTAGMFSTLFGDGDAGLKKLEAQLAAARKEVAATAAVLDGMTSVSQMTGDAVGLEMASKLARGTSAFQRLSAATGDALKQAGLTVQSGQLMTNEQAQTEKAVTALGQALQAGAGFLRTYGTSADQVTRIMDALKLKIDPVASAVADMNREMAQLGVAEGAARSALTVLQQINQQREKEGRAPLTTASPEYLTLLGKAQELETARVQSATAARAKVLDLDKQIAKAQASGNATLAAELNRQKAVEQMVARGVDRKAAEANAAQDYSVAITEAGAAAGQAAKDILLAADAQMVMAQAAGLGEAATRQATYATKLAQEAAKANGNVAAVQAANRREEAAAIVQVRNETVRGLQLETANTNALTLAMAAGGSAVRVAQEEEYKLALIRKLGTDATVAGTEAQKALNDAMEAYRQNRAANDNNRLEQERRAANDNLALAERELQLMGQAEPVRERALTTLRNQQEAARKVAELGEDGARQWLEWQEKIADTRAYVDFLKEVQATAKEISGDISEALYDRLMDPDKATSIVDVFKAIFKRIAVAALETNIVLPIVTQVVGAAPGLFGPQAPAGAGANQNGSGLIGSLTNAGLSKAGGWAMDKLGIGGSGGVSGLIDNVGYSAFGIGSPATTLAGQTVLTPSAEVLASQTAMLQAANPGLAVTASPTVTAGSSGGAAGGVASGTGLSAYAGAAGAGAFGGMLGGMLGTATNSKAVGGLSGAALGAGSAYLSYLALGSMGGPIGLAIGAVVGGIMGLLGTAKKTVGPNSSGNVVLDGKGGFRSDKALADNGADPAQMQQVTDAVAAAMNTVVGGIGAKVTGGDGANTALLQQFAKGGKWYVTPTVGDKAGQRAEFTDQGEAIAFYMRESLKGLISTGQLTGANDDVRKALDTSKATTAEGLASDLGFASTFRQQLDVMNASLDPTNNLLKTFTENAKAIGEQVKTNIVEWRDKASELGLATEGELTAAARKGIEAMMGLGPAIHPLQGMAAATKQAEINFEQFRPALQALGYTAADISGLAVRYTQKAVDAYNKTIGLVRQQGAASIEQLVDPLYKMDALDRLSSLGLDETHAAIAGLAKSITGVEDAARKGTLTIDAERDAYATLADAFAQGYLTADQLTTAVGYLTQAWQDNAATTERVAQQAAYASDLQSRMYAAIGNDRMAGLTALDQQQAVELAQAKANGYDTTLLQQVQAAERATKAFQLAQTDLLAAYDQQISAQQALVESLQAGAEAVQKFREAYDALAVNDNSPLNARDRLAEARRQFEAAYTTAKDATASEAEKLAAMATLQQLGPTLVQLAKGFYGSTDTSDYDRVRQVFAEFGGLQAQGVDTAQDQLKTANGMLAELQRQRAEAASMGQRQYGALADLKAVAEQSHTEMLKALAPLVLLAPRNWGAAESVETNKQLALQTGYTGDFGTGAWQRWIVTQSDETKALARQILTQMGQAWRINGFAVGTDSAPPGLAWVGERGPELVRMAGGERVYPHETSMAMARRFRAANDRWSGNVTALRAPSIPPIVINTAGLEQRLDRAVAVLERILGAIEDGDDETVSAISSLAKRLDRSASPVGQRRTVNG
ncbi:tape measure protein [Azospirillum picis]|uniref:Tape measure domain-containing protein n=1 Tax=Azospirillum picis TaxID=488438 RepID=A0ABU0MV16_9PROT|nr:tape measure protein [Azospirillum picis]MBP2303419.1 tape measure domain-containing protein [Azospirillum picis]MDQ0537322.1 tape measure domain-containing protein [Azospirillum picis]